MKVELKVPKLACAACTNTITKAVQKIDPLARVQADTKNKKITVETELSESAIKAAISAAGYPAV
ncbi:heavy-metal-associated domain-containing protein [Ancylothrix sp. C2]|uniref:heavy-metal-associated domain-containing protein n=1 Tax=Ancylothrix sp. D3o TaxID=2953691 RepID=UPI0021BB87EF|nr:heavy-metal-associated domain-containing protein [Ancylothrix sp. D3o]MCT7950329.1 heavy-metal-associated domain-containing protein [Ancylothrix sp. D3o]